MVYPVVAKNLLRRVSRSGLALVVAGSLGSSLPAIPPHPVRVRVEPRSTSLTPGTTISFTATVVNTTDQGVFWSVDGIPGGDDTVGTINGTGDTVTYTAPFADAAGVHRIQAESLGNTALSAMALVAVVASPVLSVVVNPPTSSLTLGAAAQQQFTAKLTGKSPLRYDLDRQLVWSALNGSITSTGLYTPPVYGGADEVFATVVWPDRHRRHRREDVPMDPPTPPAMTATGTGVITVVDPSTIGTVSVSPLTMTLRGRAKSQFTAEVTGTGHFNKGVAWFAQRGTITSEGLYTAPATGGSDVVTASSLETPAVSASATITVDVTLSRVALVPVHLDMYGPVEVQQNSGPYSEGIATVSPGVITDGWVASGGTLLSPPNFYLAQFEALAGPFMDMSFSANGTIDDRQLVVLPFPPRDYLADLNTLITSYDSTIKAQINTGNCANYYFTSYWLMGLAAAADATGDTSVMATLIGYIQQLRFLAVPGG